jgi:DNA-binding phage protein
MFDEYDPADARLCQSLKQFIDKNNKTTAQIIRESGMNRRFFFDVLACKRKPSRRYVLRMLMTLKVPLENVQQLLGAARYPQLNTHDRRDNVIIDCINDKASVDECNARLKEIDLDGL